MKMEVRSGNFPPVIQWEPLAHSPGYIELGEWFGYQYPIVKKYFKRNLEGWHLGNFLLGLGCRNVVLYAITDFTDFASQDLIRYTPEIQLKYFSCNDAHKHPSGYQGRKVREIRELVEDYLSGGIDKIVVCNIFHTNEIFEELLSVGIRLEDIISINTILYQS